MPTHGKTLEELLAAVAAFRDERNWQRYHRLKDLAAGIAIEAAELQELFLWTRPEEEKEILARQRAAVEAKLADVLIYSLNFALAAEIDLGAAVWRKLGENAAKYPATQPRTEEEAGAAWTEVD